MTSSSGDAGRLAAVLLVRLQAAVAVARIHELTNAALERPVADLEATVAAIVDAHGVAAVRAEPGDSALFVNGRAVRARRSQVEAFDGLIRTFEGVGLCELRFVRPLSTPLVRGLLGAFRAAETHPDLERRFSTLQDAIVRQGLRERVEALSRAQVASQPAQKALALAEDMHVRIAYARTMALLREYLRRMRDDELRRYFWRKLQRAVQLLVGFAPKKARELLALTLVKNADEFAFNHAVNTCLLTVLLGHKVGLSRTQLVHAGLAALVHDVGAFRSEHVIKEELAPRGVSIAGRERRIALYGSIGAVLELRRMDDAPLACALVAHDVAAESSGARDARTPHPYARIVAIAEAYDALTTPRPGRAAMLPDQALNALLRGQGKTHDATLLALFVNLLGLFPPGTVVRLDTREVAVVVHPNADLPRRPVVAVLRDPKGAPVDGAILDLAKKDCAGRFRHAIAETVDPARLGLTIPEWLRG